MFDCFGVILGTGVLYFLWRRTLICKPARLFENNEIKIGNINIWSPYNKKNITSWLKDMNFMFWWEKRFPTRSLRSLVRYRFCHSNIKFISSRYCVISSITLIFCSFVRSFVPSLPYYFKFRVKHRLHSLKTSLKTQIWVLSDMSNCKSIRYPTTIYFNLKVMLLWLNEKMIWRENDFLLVFNHCFIFLSLENNIKLFTITTLSVAMISGFAVAYIRSLGITAHSISTAIQCLWGTLVNIWKYDSFN